MMAGLLAWLDGKKTYIIMIITFILAGLNAVGIVVPEFILMILAALGLGTVRAAIKK
jgi:hypothetical protein